MDTIVSSDKKEVIISIDRPTVIIGERINPTGRKKLTEALKAGDLDIVRKEAIDQVAAGADIIDCNVNAPGVNDVELLPKAVKIVQEAVDAPMCLDSPNTAAIEAALKVYKGKPLINSVSGEEHSLKRVLPIVKEYGCAVIGLVQDDEGIPKNAERRIAIAHKIVERAEKAGVPRENIVIDVLTFAIGAEAKSGLDVLEAIRRIREELGVNMTMGASNISFGMPDRAIINNAWASAVIAAGATALITDAAKVRPAILATDLVLGRDRFARRFIEDHRKREQALKTQ
ncbi:MAG: pterin-binding protein [Chloroflexi bacterium RBG_13_51_52]|nr:MAG: pterin-binding protein [Chloroflexi bacterium RBG_13_51_52]